MIFVKGLNETPFAYAAYVISFYTLSVLCIFFAMVLPKRYQRIRQKIYDHPLGNRYLTDVAFKVRISLSTSLAINLLYSAFKLFTGIFYASLWIVAVAVYYILLSLMRFLLLSRMGQKQNAGLIGEYRSYRLTAVLMMFINLILSVIVWNMILKNEETAYSDSYVIASAAYTFYMLTVSAVDIVRYRKYKSPLLSSAKAVRFAQALVSLLSLEAVMLTQFGDDESFRTMMLALTGAGVCMVVLSMSLYMIVHATKKIIFLKQFTNKFQTKRVHSKDANKTREDPDMAKSKLVTANEKIAKKVIDGYRKVEDGVVGGYKKVEGVVVGGFQKIEDTFVDQYLAHEGESVEEAKERLNAEKEARQARAQEMTHVADGVNKKERTMK